MDSSTIASLRQANQNLSARLIQTPGELTRYMGALQAQDFPMAKWALGSRLKGYQEKDIDNALNEGTVLRTHVLRPTWHLVTPENIRWMLNLTAGRIRSSMKARHIELELDDKLLARCHRIITDALSGGRQLSREELGEIFAGFNIKTDLNRFSHILMHAETESFICSGKVNRGKQTYALLDERVPVKNSLSREESLAKLFSIYFKSHGPATLRDFTWWSGLSAADIRTAEALSAKDFEKTSFNDAVYYLPENLRDGNPENSTCLLPAFDEYIIGYADRSAILSLVHNRKAVSDNGVFRPVIILAGQVAGIWKRSVKKDTLVIDLSFFNKVKRKDLKEIGKSAKEYASFLGMEKVVINQA